jgi:hypothetical protein
MAKIRTDIPVPPIPAAGQYVFPLAPTTSSTSATLGVGTLRLSPFWLPSPIRFDRIGGEITVAGDVGSVLRMGVYGDNGAVNPKNLLVDAGTMDGGAVGVHEVTIATLTLGAGLYWIGGVVQNVTTTQPTVRALPSVVPMPLLPTGTVIGNALTVGQSMGGVTGALPATFGAPTYAMGTGPRLFVRMA